MRRRIRFILNRALCGLLLTVAVAWSASIFGAYPGTIDPIVGRGLNSRDWLSIGRSRKAGGVRYFSTVMIRALEYKPPAATASLPRWASLGDPDTSTPTHRAEHYELADGYGWPLPALGFRFHGRGTGALTTGDITGGIPLAPRSTGAWYDPRALPLTPIWGGLIVDWAVATGLVVLLWGGRREVRLWLRSRRGQCLRCGYDLRGLAGGRCPECGDVAAVQSATVAPVVQFQSKSTAGR